jgi:hypothetical protein
MAENPSVATVVVSRTTVGNQGDVVEIGKSVGEIISSGSQEVVAENRTTFVVGERVEVFWERRKCERWVY